MIPVKKRSARATILKAGLLAGTLDICSACVQYYIRTGKGPANVLRFVASGVFGKDALAGGTGMAAAGLFFHYLVAFIWTILFFIICPEVMRYIKSTVLAGILYGLVVWLIMNRVVLPLSAAPPIPFKWSAALQAALILVFAIGLPLSVIIGKYYREKI